MLSFEAQLSHCQAQIENTNTEIEKDEPTITLPLQFVPHQQHVPDNTQFDCTHVNDMAVNVQPGPTDASFKLPLREQLSGDSREWIAGLWPSTNYSTRSPGDRKSVV